MAEVRVITLKKGDISETTIYRFQQGWTVQFVLGDNLLGSDVTLRTTLTGDTALQWSGEAQSISSKAEVVCSRAGSFKYTFFCDSELAGYGYFLVAPKMSINGSPMSLDGIVCQTHLTKLLGPIDEWKDRLKVSHESGYNMLHFTPIHALGVSNSSYSLSDHHALNETLNKSDGSVATFDDVKDVVSFLEREWGILSVQDVVWNHAAKNSKWLADHPESAYNCKNSPHLRPAYIVDRALHYFGKEIGEGKWTDRGIPPEVNANQHIDSIAHALRTSVLPAIKLHEFFLLHVDVEVHKFTEHLATKDEWEELHEEVPVIPDPLWRRYGPSTDLDKACRIFARHGSNAPEAFRAHLNWLNDKATNKADEIYSSIVNACVGHIRYERVDPSGPRYPRVTEDHPLLCDYFLHLKEESSWDEDSILAFDEKESAYLMAFNGWVMSDNPLKNFALPDSEVYLRRELVCWGDSVKLNYGDASDPDSFLWKYMTEYTEKCAELFHGVRIDNAHGTPVHVAEFLLSAARRVRPDLFVFAELFTGSEELDNLFVNRLGITSLIREAMSAHDSHEQGRLVYRYGGDVVGAMHQQTLRPALPTVAHAMFLDQSHDNPSPVQSRSVYDLLPTAGMLSMASCAIGSTRGYDELLPYAVHVVSEKRKYAKWAEIGAQSGIIGARRVLNRMHTQLAQEGYSEVFVDQLHSDVVAITRHSPSNHHTVVLVAHTAFHKGNNRNKLDLRWLNVTGELEEILFEIEMVEDEAVEDVVPPGDTLRSSGRHGVRVREHVAASDAAMCIVHGKHIQLTDFFPGSVIAFKMRPGKDIEEAVHSIRETIGGRHPLDNRLDSILSSLSLQDLGRILFQCAAEEQTATGQAPYDIPNHGPLVYAGIQGLIPVLEHIRQNNDLGHPLCENLRNGLWLADYVHGRLKRYPRLVELSDVLREMFIPLNTIPFHLRPCYFDSLVLFVYSRVRAVSLAKMGVDAHSSDPFVQSLVLSSMSFVGHIPGAGLPPLPAGYPQDAPSLSAGLPHFSVGIWRNWGRDTFIALPGCLLKTNRFDEAKAIIIGFAGTLRHGLIPNLLAEGVGARYNCRDAVWFWLHSIVEYSRICPNGSDILKEKVVRIYPKDETVLGEEKREEELWTTMVEALDRHWNGIQYRERNAGSGIDEHMTDKGFNVSVHVDRETGFVHGGNEHNCGTWMDKMGSSDKAGNRGQPATPRDGAAVELQALAFTVLRKMEKWAEEGQIPVRGPANKWSWGEWAARIGAHFHTHFFVDEKDSNPLVNRRNIIKDTVGSTAKYTDYQLRPNCAIALVIAPSIIPADKAWAALDTMRDILLGPIGIKTLDPSDWAYHGWYNNSDDGDQKKTARGWNYHQGPEWVWVAAFYLRARLAIGKILQGEHLKQANREVHRRLGAYRVALNTSPWRSLPELTQQDGVYCPDSCPAQAWSIGCLLDACHDLHTVTPCAKQVY